MSLIKPALWGFDRELTSPEWSWFWEPSNISSGIIWEGGGDPYDYADRAFTTLKGSAPWSVGTPGKMLNLQATAHTQKQTIELTNLGSTVLDGLTEFTYAIYFTYTGDGTDTNEDSLGLQWSSLQSIDDSNATRILTRYQGSTNQMDFSTGTSGGNFDLIVDLDNVGVPLEGGGPQAWVFRYGGENNKSIWQEGIQIGENSNAGALKSISHNVVPEAFGGHNVTGVSGGSIQDGPQVEAYIWTFHTRAWSDVDIVQWSRDPFGPFEMFDDYPAWLITEIIANQSLSIFRRRRRF